MKECKSVIFKEDPLDPGADKLLELARVWYDLNKDTITDLHGTFGIIEDPDYPPKHYDILVLHYQGEGGINPAECDHSNLHTVIIDPARCEHVGTNHIICTDCKTIMKITHPDALEHQYEYTSNNDATCLVDGTNTGVCTLCGDVITVEDPESALGHNHEWSVYKKESCLVNRVEIGVCSRCQDIIYRTIENTALEHNYIYLSDNNATCLEDGTKTGTCTICGDKIIKPDINTALGHDYIWSTHKTESCLTDRVEIGVCSRCNDTIYRTIENTKLGHEYEYTSNNDATCLEDGTKTGKCIRCNHTITVSDPGSALGHEHVFTSDNNSTCTVDGTETGVCIRCGDIITRTESGSALGHNHVYVSNNNATCTTNGTETGTCTHCGNKVTRELENTALGHNYIYTSDNNATCTKDGTETGTCSRCGDKVTRTLENTKLEHQYEYTSNNDATCEIDGTQTGTCTHCGNQITVSDPGSALGHDYPDEWTVRITPTNLTDGLEYKKCNRCDKEITQIIPKLEHSWRNNNNGTHTCITENGCGATEACYPNGPGETCEKCGYVTPVNENFEITTEYIDGMIRDTVFSQPLISSISGSTWSIESGSLPDGISLSSDGIISGTPTTAGLYNVTIKAVNEDHETTKEFSINVADVYVTVTFNANGGTATESTRKIAKGSTLGVLPEASRDDYTFGGWFTAETGGMKVDESYSVASDITLYARWGQGDDLEFGDATSTFNIQYNEDRTNYNNQPYTFYNRYSNGDESNLIIQTAISSVGNSSNMTDDNPSVKLYMKVTNNGEAGEFDIGFDCDSYVENDDCLYITRIENGVILGDPELFRVTVPYETAIWIGRYNNRVANRYNDVDIGTRVGKPGAKAGSENDTGYAFTMKNIFINSGSYTILEVTFTKATS